MSKVVALPNIDPAEDIAAGLEHLAREIRSGAFPVAVTRVLVIVSASADRHADGVGMMEFGAEMSTTTIVGLLEIAKHQTLLESDEE